MGWPYQQKPPMGWPLDYDSGLVPNAGFWLFNEGSGNKVFDLSGNGNDGTLAGDTHWVAGKFDPALDFDGAGYINIGDRARLDLVGTDITIVAWINSTVNGVQVIVAKGLVNEWSLSTSNSVDRCLIWYSGANAGYSAANAYGTGTGGWYQVGAVFRSNSNTVTFYSNGVNHDGADSSAGAVEASNNPVVIGVDGRDLAGYEFNGQIDNVKIYNRALSASEITLLYREPFCMFKDPAEVALLGGYQAVLGAAGIMTTNTGYWGPTF